MRVPEESSTCGNVLNSTAAENCTHTHHSTNHLALTVGDIIRRYGESYRQEHTLCPEQNKALDAIGTCRTSVLGGHLYRCDRCGAEIPVYNSCDNRHCPTCQTIARLRWIEAREADLLPIPYLDAHLPWCAPYGCL